MGSISYNVVLGCGLSIEVFANGTTGENESGLLVALCPIVCVDPRKLCEHRKK